MNKDEFVKLIGANEHRHEYVPVACLLTTGAGCAGFYSAEINHDLKDTFILVNTRLTKLDHSDSHARNSVQDFSDFIQEIVASHYGHAEESIHEERDSLEESIPLAAIPFSQISVLYPVAHISELMRLGDSTKGEQEESQLPGFLDENKSIVLKLLRTKLW